jgi:hypothetical protein
MLHVDDLSPEKLSFYRATPVFPPFNFTAGGWEELRDEFRTPRLQRQEDAAICCPSGTRANT